MDLLEYQAKMLFAEVGIPVPPSQQIAHLRDLKDLQIAYPIALKSQVRAGDRARRGGIRFASNTIDAVAAAQAIFNLPIDGECPNLLLAEAKLAVARELYLAVAIDDGAKRTVLLGSVEGELDPAIAASRAASDRPPEDNPVTRVTVRDEFSPFYARRLALGMGLRGDLLRSVSDVVVKLYRLLVRYDLDSIEINPLAVDAAGRVTALDGKVTVNDGALGRHQRLVQHLALPVPGQDGASPGLWGETGGWPGLLPTGLEGNIAIISTGMGLALAALDLLWAGGGRPAAVIDLGWAAADEGQLDQRLDGALRALAQRPQVKTILVIVSTVIPAEAAIATLTSHLQGLHPSPTPLDSPRQPTPTASRVAPKLTPRHRRPVVAAALPPAAPARTLPHVVLRCCGPVVLDESTGDFLSLESDLEAAVARAIALTEGGNREPRFPARPAGTV